MNEIRNLADELRESIREGGSKKSRTTGKIAKCSPELDALLDAIALHEIQGKEKLFIRIDAKHNALLKQLKATSGLDMNKIIAYSLRSLFEHHPELIRYIKDSLKHLEL